MSRLVSQTAASALKENCRFNTNGWIQTGTTPAHAIALAPLPLQGPRLIYIGYVRPFDTEYENRVEMFNEIMNLMVLYLLICFTDFVPDLSMRFLIGYV